MDYLKRDYYANMHKQEQAELQKKRKVVQEIILEKKKHVTFEQMVRYLLKMNLDRPIQNKQMYMPLTFQ